MVDAYQDITIPFQMSSVEFFTEVYEHLAPGGVMVVQYVHALRERGQHERVPDGHDTLRLPPLLCRARERRDEHGALRER